MTSMSKKRTPDTPLGILDNQIRDMKLEFVMSSELTTQMYNHAMQMKTEADAKKHGLMGRK